MKLFFDNKLTNTNYYFFMRLFFLVKALANSFFSASDVALIAGTIVELTLSSSATNVKYASFIKYAI